ncbi:hypothetical protein B0T26DRAFT_758231 [Lasiosphaeria miniovina]|uniref:Uncharacterized protein n=1 Tax=Lasiosphaeria miniovina TaxID=1954250 RepID=A0AA40BEX4_9PEZI|nr:uncharacterized protein B0T26DRAFT_758231 [Lasiosphaeria miniovina]KAK0732941.1 hypothetical protein B0T26DRAFT_758231 [Lasiosphaeria miniovina]
MLLLVERGHFITISKQDIEDRSKANLLQEVLVITQVGWMAVQCAVREARGLPISLLELHTLVHAVCAIIMYAFWFKSPWMSETSGSLTRRRSKTRRL